MEFLLVFSTKTICVVLFVSTVPPWCWSAGSLEASRRSFWSACWGMTSVRVASLGESVLNQKQRFYHIVNAGCFNIVLHDFDEHMIVSFPFTEPQKLPPKILTYTKYQFLSHSQTCHLATCVFLPCKINTYETLAAVFKVKMAQIWPTLQTVPFCVWRDAAAHFRYFTHHRFSWRK